MIVISTEHIQAASGAVRKAIEDVQGPMPPAFVVEFLLKEWRRYLALVHQESGVESEAWRRAIVTMERLLWSATPKATPEDRADLSDALTDLVQMLKVGMDTVNTDAEARETFLTALRGMHLGMLNPARTGAGAKSGAVMSPARPVDDMSDTISMNVRDPRYRELLDLLSTDNVEQIDIVK